MNSSSAPDRHRWLSNNSMMVAAKLATSLKPNWETAKLGDIAERISTGTTPPSQERRYYDGDINWFTPADIGGNRWLSIAKKSITNEAVNEKKARIFDIGTILITCIGHIGRVGILSQISSANQQITGIRFNKTIDPEFAYYGLFARQNELQAAAPTASTLSILNQNRLSNIDFCFPSLKEQIQISKFLSWYEDRLINRQPFTNEYPILPDYLSDLPRIVERVEALAARIAKAQSLRDEASGEVDILLPRATTYALDEQSWEIQRLENVLKESPRNGFAPQSKVEGNGKRMLRINAVSSSPNRFVDLSAFNLVDVPEEKANPFYMQNNEVFVVRYNGDINRVAKAAIYKAKDDEKIIFPDKLIRLRANEEIILPDYLVFALSSRKVRSQIEELGKTTAGNIGISGSNIKSFMIPVPPLDEQRRIVAYLDSVQARLASLRELQSATGEELSALLPSVLDRAFKGEL